MRVLSLVPAFATLLHLVHGVPSPKIPGNALTPPENAELPTKSLPVVAGLGHGNITLSTGNNSIKAVSTFDRFCRDATFENRVTAASPLVDDCLKLHDNIAGSGTWTVNVFTQHRLASYQTCAFGVDANGGIGGKSSEFKVGNGDIRDIIHTSIDRFHWSETYGGAERVGAKGYMSCKPDGLSIEWGLYHT